jgi:mono/diheme cytochrome c family protein
MKMRSGVPLVALGLIGCGSISEEFGRRPEPAPQGPSIGIGPSAPGASIDTRPVQAAATQPPPITGGTLLITRDGKSIVAADPDRDRVSIVRLGGPGLPAGPTVALNRGDEPGRLVDDDHQRVHVALRRGGAVVTIDLATGTVLARREVCGAPRGIAYEAAKDLVHVACAGGELVSLPATGGDAVRRLNLDVDLRDVIVRPGGGLFVSRFKSGDLLSVSADGTVTARAKLHAIERSSDSSIEPIEPAVAWRALPTPTGGAIILHQYGLASSIKLAPPKTPDDPTPTGTFGTAQPAPPTAGGGGGEAYGTPPSGCGGLVQPAITQIEADGTSVTMGAPIVAPVLTVDAAISPDGGSVLLAHAGLRDQQAPTANDGFAAFPASIQTGVSLVVRTSVTSTDNVRAGCAIPRQVTVPGQVTAVAFNPSPTAGALFAVQTREPAGIMIFADGNGLNGQSIPLGGDSVFDTGHELFHRDAGAGIACASCHAEGGEDGRVWRFDPIGDRRTQAVHIGLKGTEPFHWDGDMSSFGVLVDEVMVRRMGGPPESDARKSALKEWLFSLRPPAPILPATDARVVRGQALFQSPEVGCAGCHMGSVFTSNQNAFVGTTDPGHVLQVPSLRGVAFRGPFIHNGCAATLRDRFDPGCGGGDQHGHTSQLGESDLGDLIAYLESL